LFVVACPHSFSQERPWTVILSGGTTIDSLTLVSVESDSLGASRNGTLLQIPLNQIVRLEHPGQSITVAGGLVVGMIGIGFGEVVYEQRVGYARSGLELGRRLPYYGGGFLLGMGLGSLIGSAMTHDEVFAFEHYPAKARINVLNTILTSEPKVSPHPHPSHPHIATNAVYVEAFGPGFLYSVNYERLVESKFALRAGFSAWDMRPEEEGTTTFIAVPLMGIYLVGDGAHKMEVGAGIDCFNERESRLSNKTLFLTTSLGYRYQPPEGGLQVRIVATPFILPGGVFFWFGTSVGACF
jgi:hypothetical protein